MIWGGVKDGVQKSEEFAIKGLQKVFPDLFAEEAEKMFEKSLNLAKEKFQGYTESRK